MTVCTDTLAEVQPCEPEKKRDSMRKQLRKITKPRVTKSELAALLGVSRPTLYKKIKFDDFSDKDRKILQKHRFLK